MDKPLTPLDPRSQLKCFRITQEEWDALPEYSISRPTGVTDGKLWKAHRIESPNGLWMDCWILCEFKIYSEATVTIFYKPVIVEHIEPDQERRFWENQNESLSSTDVSE